MFTDHNLLPVTIILVIFGSSILFLAKCTSSNSNNSNERQNNSTIQADKQQPELAEYMATLQYYTHKFALATEAENHEAARFYFHEVRALADVIKENIPGYEGYDIARFMSLFLDPTLPDVENALSSKDWSDIRDKTIKMVDACNSCHNATSHGFIQVTPGWNKNPYNQEFNIK